MNEFELSERDEKVQEEQGNKQANKSEAIIECVESVIKLLNVDKSRFDSVCCISPFSDNDKVRICIHALIRCYLFRLNSSGRLSPLFPGREAHLCRNDVCSYVIAHSIYIWASRYISPDGRPFDPREMLGSGCSFRHEIYETNTEGQIIKSDTYMETRLIVISYLDKKYGDTITHTSIMDTDFFEVILRVYEYTCFLRGLKNLPEREEGAEITPMMKGIHIAPVLVLNIDGIERNQKVRGYYKTIITTDIIFSTSPSLSSPSLSSHHLPPRYSYNHNPYDMNATPRRRLEKSRMNKGTIIDTDTEVE